MKPELILPTSFDDIMLSIYEPIAVKGLLALKKILDESGFSDSEYLKDYQVYAHLADDAVMFEINIDAEGLSDDSTTDEAPRGYNRPETSAKDKKKASLVQSKSQAKGYVKSYFIGRNNRPERINGRYDARKPLQDKLKMPRDARKISSDRTRNSNVKNSGQRYVEHELEATAPRGMEVVDKKLRVSVQRTVRNTKFVQKHPKGDFQGIMSKFIDQINQLIAEEFTPAIMGILEK
jgi:hypothetical protein